MFQKLFQVVFAVGLLFMGTPAQAGLFNTEEALNASVSFAADPMFQSVGWIAGWDSTGGYVAGSAVLIAPDWILTAGHCITRTPGANPFASISFSLSSSIYSQDPNYTAADAWYVYPGYTAEESSAHGVDLALVHLSTPITNVAPAVLFSGEDQRGTLMYMAGYGEPGTRVTGPRGFDGVKRAGSNLATDFGGDGPLAFVDPQYWIAQFDPSGFPNAQAMEWQTTPGDSGAGWFSAIDGRTYLVGINSFEGGNYSFSGAIRTSLYGDWIYSTMADIPEPGTLIMFATAAGILSLFPRRRRRNQATTHRSRVLGRAVSCALLLWLLFSTTPAQSAVYSDASALAAGEAFASDPMFQSVGWLAGWNSSGAYVAGSAVLIAPNWVLTAGHVAISPDGLGYSSMAFSLSTSIYTQPPNYVSADAVYVYPGYTLGAGGNDLALIHLSTSITDVAAAVLYSGEDQRNTLMYMAGYGAPGTATGGLDAFDGVKRAGSSVAENFGDDLPSVSLGNQYWISMFNYPDQANYQPLEWQISNGDSGGGWFAAIDSTTYLVGISCLDKGGYSYGSVSGAIRVSEYSEWMNNTMQEVPEPGTLIMFATAAGILSLFPRRRRRTFRRRLP